MYDYASLHVHCARLAAPASHQKYLKFFNSLVEGEILLRSVTKSGRGAIANLLLRCYAKNHSALPVSIVFELQLFNTAESFL